MSAETTQNQASEGESRGIRRKMTGTVTSNKMDKTVVVTVSRRFRDKRFHKFITRRVRYQAHDANNDCRVGDVVEMVESKPYSKSKRWRVTRTIVRAREDVQ